MISEENYYTDLLKRYLENRCTPNELGEVMDFLEKDSSNRLLLLQLKEQFYKQEVEKTKISSEQSDRIRQALFNKITETLGITEAPEITEAPVISINRRKWQFVAAAAVIIMIIGISSYLLLFQKNEQKPNLSQTDVQNRKYKNDVPPGGNKAVLTLADGSTIVLDDAQNGALAQQGNTKVIKLGGKLAYDPEGTGSTKIVFNTISTPKGGQYQIELPDGSQVWLNAASSLRFPTAFSGKERRVEVTGEAYFEVAKNKSKPFIVSVKGAEVQVLGTHFNVMAYNDEATMRTTLLEGAVKLVNGNASSLLKPGQQSQLLENGQFKVVNDVDVDAVTAWKNGNFDFQGVDIETIMRQLARWYDVEVVYIKKSDKLFYAEIPRNTKLSDALKALELTGKVRFDIDGKKVSVML